MRIILQPLGVLSNARIDGEHFDNSRGAGVFNRQAGAIWIDVTPRSGVTHRGAGRSIMAVATRLVASLC
jgi:hypothetical protein